MKHSIAIMIAWFGRWPIWINFFIETCRFNPDINYFIFSDCGSTENSAKNVKIIDISFCAYKQLVSEKLGIDFNPQEPYKICDIRPSFGVIHNEYIKNYDFIGFGDLDLFYGQIRDFYDNDTLNHYSVLSTHPERVSGHFFLMKNDPQLVEAYKYIPNWEHYLSSNDYYGFDEYHFTKALLKIKSKGHSTGKGMQYLFKERYSSPGPTNNMNWYWKDGILSNEFYSSGGINRQRGFLYLHIMNWYNSRWYHCHRYISQGTAAPWESANQIINIDWRQAKNEGFMISPNGINHIVWPFYINKKELPEKEELLIALLIKREQELAEIKGSKSWKIAMSLRNILRIFIPRDGKLENLLKALYKFILLKAVLPGKRFQSWRVKK